jgi:hypothetical protein
MRVLNALHGPKHISADVAGFCVEERSYDAGNSEAEQKRRVER